MSATDTAAPILVTDNDEPTLATDTFAPFQVTSDDEPTMMVVTPKKDFCIAKEMYVQPVEETSPPGNDELVL